jgi:hypothetical protein
MIEVPVNANVSLRNAWQSWLFRVTMGPSLLRPDSPQNVLDLRQCERRPHGLFCGGFARQRLFPPAVPEGLDIVETADVTVDQRLEGAEAPELAIRAPSPYEGSETPPLRASQCLG